MSLFSKWCQRKELSYLDPDFGKVKGWKKKEELVFWKISGSFWDKPVELLFLGNIEGIAPSQKDLFHNLQLQEASLRLVATQILADSYGNADLPFFSIEEQFDLKAISLEKDKAVITLQQKQNPYYYFNLHLKEKEDIWLSIDS